MAKDGERAFEALVERRSRFVFQVAYAVLRNSHDAEDVVQETFLKLYKSGTWKEIREEPAFLARVAWRLAVSRLRRIATASQAENWEPASLDPDPEQAVLDSDWEASIHQLIDALPEELRQPLVLSAIDELNSRQIAEVLGVPEGTVRTRLMRARQILRHKLAASRESRHGR